MYSRKRRFRLYRTMGPPGPPTGTSTDILAFARNIATVYRGFDAVPVDGGPLTLNSQSLGRYEMTARKASATLSSFTASDWFTSIKDTTSSWVIVNGDMTINSAITFTPPVRKLFTVLYVTGNLTVTGTISMTARGANHSGTGDSGGFTAPATIRVATGTYFGVIDTVGGSTTHPNIPASGASGGASQSAEGAPLSGATGMNGATGGGTSGVLYINAGVSAGAGSAGTCFSGGAGGGSQYAVATTSTSGGTNGGAGGNAGGNAPVGGGGAGNPGGSGSAVGESGTGGTLIVICEGTLNATGGSIVSRGSAGGSYGGIDGGGSGGGSITLMYGAISGSVTAATNGTGSSPGGSGSFRRYALA